MKESCCTFLVVAKALSRRALNCSAVRFTLTTTPSKSGRIRATALERRCAGEAGRAIREGVTGKSTSAPRKGGRFLEGDVDLRWVCKVPRRLLVTTTLAPGEAPSDSSLQQTKQRTVGGTTVNIVSKQRLTEGARYPCELMPCGHKALQNKQHTG